MRVLEVPASGDAEVAHDVGERVAAQLLELFERPHVELALDAFGVGILGGEEAAVGVVEVAQDVGDGLLDDASVALGPGHHPPVQVGAHEQGLVVEHLLEVGNEPVRVDRVAVEAATDLVVDAAGRHRVERSRGHLEHLGTRSTGGDVEQERDGHRLRELGCAPEAAEAGVVLLVQAGDRALEDRGRQRAALPAADRGALLDRLMQLLGLLVELVAPVMPRVVDRLEQAHEAGHPLTVFRREVGAAEERATLVVEEDGHRPAAAARHRLHRLHVDGVDVGAFLTVDLHVDEPVVHLRGDGGVLERLVRHHVAPVARRVPDRQQDRLVGGAGLARTPPRPTGTSRPDCRRVGAGRGWSRARAGSA